MGVPESPPRLLIFVPSICVRFLGVVALGLVLLFNKVEITHSSSVLAESLETLKAGNSPVCELRIDDSHLLLRGGSSTVVTADLEEVIGNTKKMTSKESSEIQIVFSDVDGTLVHYPKDAQNIQGSQGNRILHLPPSSTGMQGIISSRTLSQCQELRRLGKKLVIISGMRTSTLLKRLPYLPRADAYCSEAGGRMFYPVSDIQEGYTGVLVTPQPYDGAQQSDVTPFGIVEDLVWRSSMESLEAAGTDGYVGAVISDSNDPIVPLVDRKGLLWEFARSLTDKGYVVDFAGYSACFRVNRKQQNKMTHVEFDALSSSQVDIPTGLGTSVNLGCVDFYPAHSGKKNGCLYLAKRFCNTADDLVLSKHALCVCDDDNDLEMALACQHAFVPGVSSESMAQAINDNPNHITVTGGPNVEGTSATEAALQLVLEKAIHEDN